MPTTDHKVTRNTNFNLEMRWFKKTIKLKNKRRDLQEGEDFDKPECRGGI